MKVLSVIGTGIMMYVVFDAFVQKEQSLWARLMRYAR